MDFNQRKTKTTEVKKIAKIITKGKRKYNKNRVHKKQKQQKFSQKSWVRWKNEFLKVN